MATRDEIVNEIISISSRFNTSKGSDAFLSLINELDHIRGLLIGNLTLDADFVKATEAEIEFLKGKCYHIIAAYDPNNYYKAINHWHNAVRIKPNHEAQKFLERFDNKQYEQKAFDDYENAKQKSQAQQSGCFIATAAFGTPLAEEVIVLSKFRDEYLSRSSWGRKLISFYYKISPPLVCLITS